MVRACGLAVSRPLANLLESLVSRPIMPRGSALALLWALGLTAVTLGPAACGDRDPDTCDVDDPDSCYSTQICVLGSDGLGWCEQRAPANTAAEDASECAGFALDWTGACQECASDEQCRDVAFTVGYANWSEFKCVANPARAGELLCAATREGGPCSASDQCIDSYCKIPDGADWGTCRYSLRAEAAPEGSCASHDACIPSLWCGDDGCVEDRHSGAACTEDEQCTSNLCEAGLCATCTTSDACGADAECVDGSCVPACGSEAVVVQRVELRPNAAGTNPYGFDNIEVHLHFDRSATVEATRLGRSGVSPAQASVLSTEATGESMAIPWHSGTGSILLEEDVDGTTCPQTVPIPELTPAQRDAWSVPVGWQ